MIWHLLRSITARCLSPYHNHIKQAGMYLSRSQHRVCSQTYNTRLYLSRFQRMYHFQLCSLFLAAPLKDSDTVTFISLKLNFFHWKQWLILLSSFGSDLEAFSLYQADVSITAMAFQPTILQIIWPNCSSRTKLDYCLSIVFISRVKLTCLTTV